MMKRFIYGALIALTFAGFQSCSDDNNGTEPIPVDTVDGFYVINGGNKSGNIPGSVTAFSYTSMTASQDAFMAKNNVGVGDTPEHALIYGSKMYISVYRSNLIWVVDPSTLEIIKSIPFEGDAKNPRSLAAKDGKVYTSLYTGYVARIDTVSLSVEATVKVGNNPDQIAIGGNNLYVANSDGSQSKLGYPDSSMSIINLSNFSERKVQIGQNPTDMVSNGTDVFVICKGDYEGNPSVVKKVEGENAREICRGTNFAIAGDMLYVINAPYSKPDAEKPEYTYKVYDAKSCAFVRDMVAEGVDSPSGIGVDLTRGDIVILSYNLDANGNSLYREPGYGVIYDTNGTVVKKFDTGVGCRSVVFRHVTIFI